MSRRHEDKLAGGDRVDAVGLEVVGVVTWVPAREIVRHGGVLLLQLGRAGALGVGEGDHREGVADGRKAPLVHTGDLGAN